MTPYGPFQVRCPSCKTVLTTGRSDLATHVHIECACGTGIQGKRPTGADDELSALIKQPKPSPGRSRMLSFRPWKQLIAAAKEKP